MSFQRTVTVHVRTQVINIIHGVQMIIGSVQMESGKGKSMEEKNALPCKKCGAGFLRILYSVGGRVAISCPKCSYCTKYKQTKEEAIDAWNQRNRT